MPAWLERAIEQRAGWADERRAVEVLLVARLLAHEHQARPRGALTEHGLRGVAPEVACPAVGRGGTQLGQASAWRGSGHLLRNVHARRGADAMPCARRRRAGPMFDAPRGAWDNPAALAPEPAPSRARGAWWP